METFLQKQSRIHPKMLLSFNMFDVKVLLIVSESIQITNSRLKSLLECGAKVILVSSEMDDTTKSLISLAKDRIQSHERMFKPDDIKNNPGISYVFCVTSNPAIARFVYEISLDNGVNVNCENYMEYSTFHLVPQHRDGHIMVYIHTIVSFINE